MGRSTVFKTHRGQAVRLPEAVAMPDSVKRVELVKQGKGRLILPVGAVWDDFFDAPGLPDDFMAERGQPRSG
ncbi:MAG: type II toxin-antitoxin system VapB family antitoxin [Oceanicaulis sp.]|nr:type II toxin-antitoxin system VapB family antitoxin [Oceanicaulis sp.]